MPKIFISYRRSESPYVAQTIYKRLVKRYGKAAVFFDVDKIPPGVDFPSYLNKNLNQCQVLLAIIGTNWLNVTDSQGDRRLDNPKDWVRQEIERGLAQPEMLVVPVLINEASMPKANQLPPSLQALAYRNQHPVRPGRDLQKDIDWLIQDLDKHLRKSIPGRVQNLIGAFFNREPVEEPKPTFSFEVVTVDDKGQVIERTQAIAEYFTEDLGNSMQLDLVRIPGGMFQMGALAGERGVDSAETPQHWVTISEFWMGKFPVTQAQYQAIMG